MVPSSHPRSKLDSCCSSADVSVHTCILEHEPACSNNSWWPACGPRRCGQPVCGLGGHSRPACGPKRCGRPACGLRRCGRPACGLGGCGDRWRNYLQHGRKFRLERGWLLRVLQCVLHQTSQQLLYLLPSLGCNIDLPSLATTAGTSLQPEPSSVQLVDVAACGFVSKVALSCSITICAVPCPSQPSP